MKRNLGPLLAGLFLVGLGVLLLTLDRISFPVLWRDLLPLLFIGLFLLLGLVKLARHFVTGDTDTEGRPHKPQLLSGLFWVFLGVVLLLDRAGALESLEFIGAYWPLLFILYGLGKIIDFYRFGGRTRVRPIEVLGLVFIACIGIASGHVARAHIGLLPGLSNGDWPGWFGDFTEEKHSFNQNLEIPLQAIEKIEIKNAYGNVKVLPRDEGGVTVQLTSVVRSDEEEAARRIADRIEILQTDQEGVLRLGTNRLTLGEKGRRVNTNLFISIPEGIPVSVINQYGDVSISHRKAPCQVDNAYGEVDLDEITGAVTVSNRYRDVNVRNVQGDVKVENRRADIRLSRIAGNVEAKTDYDLISLSHVSKDVTVSNHFGRVVLEDIGGKSTVQSPGSRVTASQLKSESSIENSHKTVEVRDTFAPLTINSSYSRVRLERITAPVTLNAAHARISGEDIQDGFRFQGTASEVSLENVRGQIEVETTLNKIRITNFQGATRVQNEYGDIELSTESALTGPIKAINRNGAILVRLPPEASFELSAQAKGGAIHSDFGEAKEDAMDDSIQFLETQQGQGGPSIELQTTYSRIRIEKRG